MINIFKIIISLFLAAFISSNATAEALVVDDSENYALLEQQTAQAPSVAESSSNFDNYENTTSALAKDNANDSYIEDKSDSSGKIAGLQQEIQELRGQLEVQAHELKVLKDQQLAFYKDLDARIQNPNKPLDMSKNQDQPTLNLDDNNDDAQKPIPALKTNTSAASQTQPNYLAQGYKSSNKTNPADEQISYLAAYELVKNKQFPEALTALQNFIKKYPNGYYAANAEYWTGELYLSNKDYKDAISHFDTVIKKYPSSNKYSASLLKLGFALADSGQINEARSKLKEVVQKYPDTTTSALAQTKLKQINS